MTAMNPAATGGGGELLAGSILRPLRGAGSARGASGGLGGADVERVWSAPHRRFVILFYPQTSASHGKTENEKAAMLAALQDTES
jgi:hypothetical protein